jgi:SNF2 family DNA or RNA helicase
MGRFLKHSAKVIHTKYNLPQVCESAKLAMSDAEKARGALNRLKTEVAQAVELIVEEDADESIKKAPLSELGKLGARIGPLLKHGLVKVADLKGHTFRSLDNIPGMGEVSARGTLTAYNTYIQKIRASVRILPDPDKRRSADTKLLLALARYDALSTELSLMMPDLERTALEISKTLSYIIQNDKIINLITNEDINLKFESGNTRISELARALKTKSAAILERERVIHFDAKDVWNEYVRNGAAFVALLESIKPDKRNINENTEEIRGFTGGLPAAIAEAVENQAISLDLLSARLRQYQIFGVRYIVRQNRVLLGDDMGLGKTIQVLAAMCHYASRKGQHFLVVAPNSVLINWEREVRKHTKLNPVILHGNDRNDKIAYWNRNGGVAITTYGTITKIFSKITQLDFLAVDEAHVVKNPNTQRSNTIAELCTLAQSVVLMTGTPLENRLQDLHALLTIAQPESLKNTSSLLLEARPEPNKVHKQLAPCYLRRKQTDVLTELPDLIEIDEVVELTKEGAEAYAAAPNHIMGKRIAATRARSGFTSAKYERLQELLETYQAEERKVAVFSFFLQVLEDVASIQGGDFFHIHGGIGTAERQRIVDAFSAKPGFAVIGLQIEAGGIGINLQSAQIVVLMEPQFKPSTELQAVARVRRMGQMRKVTVHRLIAKDTIDEYLMELTKEKQRIFDTYVQESSIKDSSRMASDGGYDVIIRDEELLQYAKKRDMMVRSGVSD